MSNKFTSYREVRRLMSSEEVLEEAKELGLDEKATKHILKDFEEARERYDELLSEEGEEYAQIIIGQNGRMACGQSWEHYCEQLAVAMGVDEEDAWDAGPCGEDERVNKVFNAFYEE